MPTQPHAPPQTHTVADLRRVVDAETPADGTPPTYQLMNQSLYPPALLEESVEADSRSLKEAGLVNARLRQRMI